MPRGITKENFADFEKYYDEDVFIAAGKRIRNLVMAADKLNVTERTKKIAELFSYFKNPDKETVLTPWRVVNMHLGDCLGGYSFFDKNYEQPLGENEPPHFINVKDVTEKTLGNSEAKILEINSKTGLYPLYCAYSIFRAKKAKSVSVEQSSAMIEQNSTVVEPVETTTEESLWQETIRENIYVICKTPMAKAITQRTLCGFTGTRINAHAFDHLVNDLKNKSDSFIKDITSENFWKKGNGKMEFDVIVGNPPYQEMDGGGMASAVPVYQYFVENAQKMKANYVSMIMPSRWFSGGRGLDNFRNKMLQNDSIRCLYDFLDARDCFPNVEIKGGICFFLYDKNYHGDAVITTIGNEKSTLKRPMSEENCSIFIRYNEGVSILRKTKKLNQQSFIEIVSSQKPFGLRTYVHGKNKPFENAIKLYENKNIGYISRAEITANKNWIEKYKVYITAAYGAGEGFPHQILNKPIFGEKNSCCTETYMLIGPFESKQEAENVISYIKTKYFRFMILLIKNTQHAPASVYQFVPLQDFSSNSDIDWSKSIPEIDSQLYKKYNLSKDEIDFIEKMIRPMS